MRFKGGSVEPVNARQAEADHQPAHASTRSSSAASLSRRSSASISAILPAWSVAAPPSTSRKFRPILPIVRIPLSTRMLTLIRRCVIWLFAVAPAQPAQPRQ